MGMFILCLHNWSANVTQTTPTLDGRMQGVVGSRSVLLPVGYVEEEGVDLCMLFLCN